MAHRILVVDDSDEMQDLYQAVLQVQGYEIVQARDGMEGIAALHEGPLPDLVVLDISMPKLSGWDVLRVVRDTAEWQDIPILVISALGQPVNVQRGWSLGAASYLYKPVAVDELVLMVNRLVSLRTQAECNPA
ncbi:MAG: response regulator [Armatimonadetes bacterium]|jgi:DNA-binding response OmpR family regulator|nr:response regulator [Armatimonadota bacterium]MDI9583172.1 response regulator [Acidobacteriota bacterium]